MRDKEGEEVDRNRPATDTRGLSRTVKIISVSENKGERRNQSKYYMQVDKQAK